MDMKKFKYLLIVLILVFLSLYLYQNYIYYKIPYNPISKYAATPSGFHITKNLPNGEEVSVKSHDVDACNKALKYFSDLKLVPLKNKAAWNENSKQKSQTYFSGMFEFTQSNSLSINEIYLDNLTILYISSDKPGFHNGYYKIVGSEFDYKYIYDLIDNSKE